MKAQQLHPTDISTVESIFTLVYHLVAQNFWYMYIDEVPLGEMEISHDHEQIEFQQQQQRK